MVIHVSHYIIDKMKPLKKIILRKVARQDGVAGQACRAAQTQRFIIIEIIIFAVFILGGIASL